MPSILRVVAFTLLFTPACSKRDAKESAPTAVLGAASFGAASAVVPPRETPPTTELETVSDPVENAFSMGMPKGWHNRTYSARVDEIHSMVATSVSPDGNVLIFSGDPSIPSYTSPAAATPFDRQLAQKNPRKKIEAFTRAVDYFPSYVKRKFGRLAGFELLSTTPDLAAEAAMRKRFAEKGLPMDPTIANVSFRYHDGGKSMRALVIGTTSNAGAFWMASVSGITTTGDPKAYLVMLEAMGRTHRMNPAWQAEQNRKHQERMAQSAAFGRKMTAQHQRNMAGIQQSAQRHQQRMQAISAAGDASMKRYYDRMAAGDANHRGFLNYINEERTVVGSGGKTYQVDSSYQRYFVNKSTGKYVGGDIRLDQDKLRSFGLNPDDYEEVKIKQ